MKLNKSQFDYAFRQVLKIEFDEYLDKAENSGYINQYDQREFVTNEGINNSFRSQCFNKSTFKVLAYFCLFVFVVFFSCNAVALSKPIQSFLEKKTGSTEYFMFDIQENRKINYKYELTYIPLGFEEYEYQETDEEITSVYKNEKGEIIKYIQQAMNPDGLIVDIKNADKDIIKINGTSVNVYSTDKCIVGVWVKDSYLMTLSFFGAADLKEFVKIIESIK